MPIANQKISNTVVDLFLAKIVWLIGAVPFKWENNKGFSQRFAKSNNTDWFT